MLMAGFVAVTTANVLAGTLFEFIKRPSRVSVAVLGDVAIAAGNTYTFQVGDTVIATAAQVFPAIVNTATSFIVGIRYPDHYHIQNEPALAGDRLVLSIVRGTGNILWSVQIVEVA